MVPFSFLTLMLLIHILRVSHTCFRKHIGFIGSSNASLTVLFGVLRHTGSQERNFLYVASALLIVV